MPLFRCVKKCLARVASPPVGPVRTRLFEFGEIIEAEQRPNKHFKPVQDKHRPEPKWGLTGGVWVKPPLFRESDAWQIEEIIKAKVDSAFIKRLAEAGQRLEYEMAVQPPRPSETKVTLEAVGEALREGGRKFRDTWYNMDVFTRQTVYCALRAEGVNPDEVNRERLRLAEDREDPETWARLRQALGQVLERLHAETPDDPGGRPRSAGLRSFIVALGALFEEATGRQPAVTYDNYNYKENFSGRFFGFVEWALTRVGLTRCSRPWPRRYRHRPLTNQALGQMIKRALKG